MGTTTNYSLPYPEGTDPVVVHTDVKKLADMTDEKLKTTNDRVDSAEQGIDDARFYRRWLTADDRLDNLTTGNYWSNTMAISEAVGLPAGLRGTLYLTRDGSNGNAIFMSNGGEHPIRFLLNERVGGTWVGWTPIVDQQVESLSEPVPLTETDHLDDCTPGIRYAAILAAVTGDPLKGYPPGAVHGYVDTIQLRAAPSEYLFQLWTDTWTNFTAHRIFYSGTWREWVIAGDDARVSDLETRVAALEAGGGSFLGDTWAMPAAWASSTDIVWSRPDGSTRIIPAGYQGDGYVGLMAATGGYTQLMATKVEESGTVEVSCLNPVTDRHVTYRIQGAWDGTDQSIDGFRRIEDISVGTYSGTTINKQVTMLERSNMEFAQRIDVGGVLAWVPHHNGLPTAHGLGVARFTDGQGQSVDIESLTVGQSITGLNGLRLYHSIYGTHPDKGDTKLIRVDQVTTVSPNGMIQSETLWTALEDVKLGTNYGPMTPIQMGLVDSLEVLDGNTYPLLTSPPSSNQYITITEGKSVDSFRMTGGGYFVAAAFLEPERTFLKDHPDTETSTPVRIEQRSAGLVKVYPEGFKAGSVLPAGTTWRSGAQWRYGETS